jgi:AcrR family transcriptional regulator
MTAKTVHHAAAAKPAPEKRRRKEARPAEIMAAALKLFSEKGFAATRLEDVAESAGISKATIYLYFRSKVELFVAIVRDIASPRIQAMETMSAGFAGTSEDLICAVIGAMREITSVREIRAIIKIIVAEAGNFPEIADFYRTEILRRGLGNMTRIIERGIERGEFRPCDPLATTQSIILPIMMNALARETFGPILELDPDRFFPSHLEFVLRGLAAGREA